MAAGRRTTQMGIDYRRHSNCFTDVIHSLMFYWQLERSIYLRVFLRFGDSIRSFLPRFNDMAFPIIDIYKIQRSTKGQWYAALMLSLLLVWQTVEQTVQWPVICYAVMSRHCNAGRQGCKGARIHWMKVWPGTHMTCITHLTDLMQFIGDLFLWLHDGSIVWWCLNAYM